MMEINVRCMMCGKVVTIKVEQKDLEEFQSPNRRRLIQDIFPYLSAGERELLISGVCDECFHDMFGDDDEDEDDWDAEYEPSAEDLREWQNASCGLC